MFSSVIFFIVTVSTDPTVHRQDEGIGGLWTCIDLNVGHTVRLETALNTVIACGMLLFTFGACLWYTVCLFLGCGFLGVRYLEAILYCKVQ